MKGGWGVVEGGEGRVEEGGVVRVRGVMVGILVVESELRGVGGGGARIEGVVIEGEGVGTWGGVTGVV